MLRATLKSLMSRKLRLVLSGLAVVLGVMFVSGAFVLTDTMGRSFDSLFASVYQGTDVNVTQKSKVGDQDFGPSQQANIPAATLDKVRAVPGVASVTGEATADGARVIGKNGKVVTTFGPPRLGGNWVGTSDLLQLREGRAPAADNEIVVNVTTAKSAGGLKVGDDVGVLTLQPGKRVFKLVGIFGYSGDRDSLGGSLEVLFTTPVAQELMLGEKDVYSSINVTAADGVTNEKLRDDIAAALGGEAAGFQVKTGQQLTDETTKEFRDGLAFFNNVLIGFAGVALFVGTFLILNTFSIIVAQRTRELALMRALGGSRGQTLGSVIIEAVAIGLIASVLGLAAGIGVGVLLAWVFGNVSGVELASVGVPAAAVISAFVVGLLVTVVAAVLPALRASRIPPIAALQEVATPDRPLTKLTVSGALVGAAGGTMLGLGLAGQGDNTLWLILGGVLVSFIGVALLTPLLARPVVSLLGRLFSWSVPGKLGRLNSGRNPRRTAITAAALMVGLALITGVNVILASAKQSLSSQAATQVTVDLIISGDGDDNGPAKFDPAVMTAAAKLPGVASAASEYWDFAQVDGEGRGISATPDMAAYAGMFKLVATEGTLAWSGPDQAVIDVENAKKRNLKLGSTMTMQFTRGQPHQVKIVGLYQKSDVMGGLVVSGDVVKDFRTAQPSWGYLRVSDGTSVDSIQRQVDQLLVDNPEVSVANRAEFVDAQAAQFDQLLVMIQVLLALAILIAVLGIVNTLALSVLERTRELGLLRAIGMRRAQTMRMVTVEAVVISTFGALLGLAVGTGLGAAVVRALKDDGFTKLAFPWSQMATYLLLAALVGVVAAVLPSIRASRVNVLQAIAHD
ncbi:FtsX-like permease family protein [Dactylosporangium aurantiacum]|uniref:FtsX-like permease family protein n=1 Tax=Dactylosporangium aurantiacum TaxID=35754 RepID=A0A9Q9IBR4_9ACTN|nr:ABC transporter permease [Dactylosporangium aurantiacum]MDG6101979.1 FtsX-like permease family protein [Dactylosporangium aurantiacum]UWZ52236.1 FtsX-like permease family protein [Dactylosporangium aurantiacum]